MSSTGRPPDLTHTAVIKLIQHLYSFEFIDEHPVKQLPSFDDRNYYFIGTHVDKSGLSPGAAQDDIAKPTEHVLKIFNCEHNDPEVVNGVSSLMKHLYTRGFNGVSQIESKDGRTIPSITHDELYKCVDYSSRNERRATNRYCVRIVKFIPGEVLASIRKDHVTAHLLYDVGHYLGQIDRALSDGFAESALRERVLADYDLLHFQTTYRRYISTVEEPKRREMAKKIFDSFKAHISPKISFFKQGILHNDANSHNIIVRGSKDSGYEVAGFIDHDDAVNSCYLFELGILIAHMLIEKTYPEDCPNPLEFLTPLISGYWNEFPLSLEELDCLYYVVVARCCQLALASGVCYKNEPSNSYILLSLEPSWDAMELILSTPKTEADRMWRNAVGKSDKDYV